MNINESPTYALQQLLWFAVMIFVKYLNRISFILRVSDTIDQKKRINKRCIVTSNRQGQMTFNRFKFSV